MGRCKQSKKSKIAGRKRIRRRSSDSLVFVHL